MTEGPMTTLPARHEGHPSVLSSEGALLAHDYPEGRLARRRPGVRRAGSRCATAW
jgi:hypothetical protein